MAHGVGAGLQALEGALHEGGLDDYGPAHSTAAEMYAAAGRNDDARQAYLRALGLCRQEPERRLLKRRLRQLCV